MTPEEKRIFDLIRSELRPDVVPPEYRGVVDSMYCGHCHHASIANVHLSFINAVF